ncbi:TetR/AcrR family transcriptional regulator [Rhodococcus sp. WY5]|uniref:TetR/AcrR family transcriptional regulator n=1 Tax=Rhodococcus sp. WY5 TaxID=2708349 RepID=UPI001BDEE9A4|nr:TetR/AcrR family transcriptional regulator [Rhodococcus sp. WY5]
MRPTPDKDFAAMSDILTSPPTHSPSPRRYRQQPRAIATRERILLVSAEMFDANGYAGAGINEMLDSSGLSKGALYFHFESKEAIAQALIDQWRTFVDDLRHEVNSTETSALAQIVMLFREHAEAVSEDLRLRAGLKLSVEQGITGSGGAYREWVDMVEALVATAIDRGELHDNDAAQRFSEASCTTFLGTVTAPPLMNTSPSITVAIDDMLTGWLIGVLSAEDPQRALTATS